MTQLDEARPGFGLVDADGPHAATRDELVAAARSGTIPALVWTPETPEPVPPEEVPFLLDAIRERMMAGARGPATLLAVIVVVGAAVAAYAGVLTPGEPALVFLVMGAAWVALGAREWRRARDLTADGFREIRRQAIDAARVAREPALFTNALAVAVGVVAAAQVIAEMVAGREWGVEAGWLSRDGVGSGEWWRLLTAALLHGSPIHLIFNFSALRSLGREIEVLTHRSFVPIVFLVAALTGGAASLILPPDQNSVGSSGGILGMIGFLGVLGYRRRDLLPPGLLDNVMINLALVAGMGLAGYRFIDNAAHLGGLVGGAAVGLLLVPGSARREWVPGVMVRRVGEGALAVIAAAALWTTYVVLASLL
ncbi:MAG TPA: rhomboid family intramembrane serine protease [Longimicrobium sp.]|nr:rhomboid family intramembrane serine protease [Longimicrobium sp.]